MEKKYKILITAVFTLAIAAALLISSCATAAPAASAPGAAASAAAVEGPAGNVYEGTGQDGSMLKAMNLAKMDAVRKAVIDMIGVGNERANQDKLQEVLYRTNNPNAFINTDTYETLRKDKVGNDFLIECRVAVKLSAVESVLKANGIWGEGVTAEVKSAEAAKESEEAAKAGVDEIEKLTEAGEIDLTPEEQRIIARYVNNMTFMVYFDEEAAEDAFYIKAAIGIANEFLTSNSLETIDLDQMEKLKKDRQRVYEEETGESISMVQWIAQKLNADVYIEIDGITSGESSGGKFYGQANITVKGFESSTGRLLGSQPWNSPKTFSTSSEESARINALQTSVYKAMPIVINQAKAYMAKTLRNGIKYEVIIQNTPDSRTLSNFRRKLKRKVRDIETVSQSAEETKYYIYLIGSIEDLVDAIYDVADTIPGLEALDQVLLRGKSVTFNSGM